jgi:hypothetical protein
MIPRPRMALGRDLGPVFAVLLFDFEIPVVEIVG